MLSMLVLMLTPISMRYANNNQNTELSHDSGFDKNSQTMTFIDTMFNKLVTMDSTMLKAQKKWDVVKQQDDVIELCLAWDNVIEGEKFQVLKQETNLLLKNANQKMNASTFGKSIEMRTETVKNKTIDGIQTVGSYITSDYLDRLKAIYEANTNDIHKIVFYVLDMNNKLKDNKAIQAYNNLMESEMLGFIAEIQHESFESSTPIDYAYAYIKVIYNLIQSDEMKQLKCDPDVVALNQELINKILSHEDLMISLVDFLIDVETDLFDLVNELLTLDINPFGKALYDFLDDESTQVLIDLHFNDNVVWHYGCPQTPLLKDFGLLEPMMESKTFKSIALLSEIIETVDIQHDDTPQYTCESSQIDRLIGNHVQLLENLGKTLKKNWKQIGVMKLTSRVNQNRILRLSRLKALTITIKL